MGKIPLVSRVVNAVLIVTLTLLIVPLFLELGTTWISAPSTLQGLLGILCLAFAGTGVVLAGWAFYSFVLVGEMKSDDQS